MKLEAVLCTLLLGSLIACSGSKDDAPADAQQPAAATKPTTSVDATKTEGGGDHTADVPPATEPKPDPVTTTDPPAPVAETCESLAAKAATPAGKISDAQEGFVDVYATETEEGLDITLTATANTCAYRANNLQASQMNELTYRFPKTDKEFGAGTFKVSDFSQEGGTTCFADDEFGQMGTAWSGGSASGKLTITAKTATLVEGTVEVTTFGGSKNTFTFSAPICAAVDPNASLTCCLSSK